MAKKRAKKKAAPKATVKRATKKPTPRAAKSARTVDNISKLRTSSRQRVYSLTREIPEHQYFVLANGQPVKHVAELASILDQLEDHVFSHHVTPDHNDFHNWIKDVFEDVELARKVTGVSDKRRLQLVIYRHLAGHDK